MEELVEVIHLIQMDLVEVVQVVLSFKILVELYVVEM